MRIIAITIAVCAFAQTALSQERHAFSQATTAPCMVHDIFEHAETHMVSSVVLLCVDGPTRYRKKRSTEEAERGISNWPTPAWNGARRGDAVTCALEHRPMGKNFFIVEHTFEHCMLDKPKVTVEVQ